VKRFSIGEAVSYGWNTVKANLGLFVALALVYFILTGAPTGAARHGTGIAGPVSGLLGMLMMMGIVRIVLKFVDGGKAQFSELWANFDMFLNYLGASILYGLIVVGGLCLLIVPGIIWALRFGYFGYFIIDKKCGVMESLRQSTALTTGVKMDLFVLGLAIIGINLLGAIALGVGLLVTVPLSWLAFGYVYRKLQGTTVVAAPTEPAAG
jgi:uncharacterized membrane protein